MIKRTLYFGNPSYLSMHLEQLNIKLLADGTTKTVPLEDIGVVILDHPQITLTQPVMSQLLQHNVAVISCDSKHHPTGLLLPLVGHSKQSKHFRLQAEASEPLKKQLWQSTIQAKIANQAKLLDKLGKPSATLKMLEKSVKSGDKENAEAQAAAYYWKQLFEETLDFQRNRFGESPNAWLNYGYAILRALVARSLVGSGLLPTLGIFHRNQYNAYCLADDVMEPYRPFVDACVWTLLAQYSTEEEELPKAVKTQLLQIPAMDVCLKKRKSPLMVAVQQTTASLARSFEANSNQIVYPSFV